MTAVKAGSDEKDDKREPTPAAPGPLLHGVAGASAALVSSMLLYPLDQVGSAMQSASALARQRSPGAWSAAVGALVDQGPMAVMAGMLHEGGVAGFYRGMISFLQTVGISYFVYFVLYQSMQAYRRRTSWVLKLPRFLGDMFASLTAGVFSVLITAPLWVAATRLKLRQADHGLWTEIWTIAQLEGVPTLWKGVSSSLVLVSNPVIQFVLYDALKRLLLQRRANRQDHSVTDSSQKGAGSLLAWEAFLAGAATKAVATFSTYPLQVAQTQLRATHSAAGSSAEDLPLGTIGVLSELLLSHGLRGWFVGLEAKLCQTVLQAAFMFACYERLVAGLAQLHKACEGALTRRCHGAKRRTVVAVDVAEYNEDATKPLSGAVELRRRVVECIGNEDQVKRMAGDGEGPHDTPLAGA